MTNYKIKDIKKLFNGKIIQKLGNNEKQNENKMKTKWKQNENKMKTKWKQMIKIEKNQKKSMKKT